MKYLLLFSFVALFFLSSFQSKKTSSNHKEKWVSLFNGKEISNWTPKISGYKLGENFGNTFRVENGILETRYDAYDNFKNRFGALYYNKKFENFKLRVEYRFQGDTVAGAPSWGYQDGGVQYQCQDPASIGFDQSFPVCLEYNCLGTRTSGEICANGIYFEINGKRNASYCTAPVIKKIIPGNEWVTAEIDVHDGKIIHYINGEEVLRFENPKYDTSNTLVKKLNITKDVVKEGYISLQSNSHPMDFRKIEIMEY